MLQGTTLLLEAVTVLSSHFHLLLIVDDAKEVADFMRDLQSKAAREVNRLTGWRGPVFERRYEMTVVTNEEGAQVERLKYVLANGVKENLVERFCEWPGVHSAEALVHGTPLQGHWFDRTGQALQPVDRALYPPAAAVEDVGVDHCRLDALVAQDLPHRPDVTA